MTVYKEKIRKETEFYNIFPAHFFSIYNGSIDKHCLCFKIDDLSYFNTETKEYIKLSSDNIDMMVDIVEATVEWCYA